jgi:hypothetical protein
MLFKALIERLLGGAEAQDWSESLFAKASRFSYSNYPNLIGILASILDKKGSPTDKQVDGTASQALLTTEAVFPALQILQQAPPPETYRNAIHNSVLRLSKSTQWHLRDMAARTLASLLRPAERLEMVMILFTTRETSLNAAHGTLLCLKHILKKIFRADHGLKQGTYSLRDRLHGLLGLL